MREYRVKVANLWTGVICTSFFVLMGGASVAAALWNFDGSFARPVLAAILFGAVWGGMSLIGVWIIADYLRSRLLVSEAGVAKLGVVRSRAVEIERLEEARWRPLPRGGSLLLREGRVRLTIRFADYSAGDARELIDRLREQIPRERQSGWEEFSERDRQRKLDPRASMQVSLVLALVFGGFAVLPVALAGRGVFAGPQSVTLVVANLVGVAACLRSAWRDWRKLRSSAAAGENAADA